MAEMFGAIPTPKPGHWSGAIWVPDTDPAQATDQEVTDAIAANVDNQGGIFKMLQGWIPNGWYWIVVTQQIDGWDAPEFSTLDGIGSYTAEPFTAYAALGAIPFDTWEQNLQGAPIKVNLPAAIIATDKGQDGHIYLIVSPDKATDFRIDGFGLRDGAAIR